MRQRTIIGGKGRVLVLGLVLSSVTNPTPEMLAPIKDPAAAATRKTGEPGPVATEMHSGGCERHEFVDLVGVASAGVPVVQPNSALLDLVTDTRRFGSSVGPRNHA